MLQKRHERILLEMLSLPTAPFTEEHVREYIFDFCRQRKGITVREDRVGNILVHYKHPTTKAKRPVCLCAHMDHPGFRAIRMLNKNTLKAQWFGGVSPEYFPKAQVRFFSNGEWIRGKITKTRVKTLGLEKPHPMVDTVDIAIRGPVEPASPGMWDLPEPKIKDGKVSARDCDDIAGCSAMLSCIDILTRTRAKADAYFLFTRAEEVGFIGAIAACRYKTIPKKCLVVAIETSSVIPGVTMGAGPILRVGDKSSIFDPDLTAWCGQVAEQLAKRDKQFTYQRKLMDGGSCESTAYCQLGYQATGICIALGNYHNCNTQRNKLGSEFVSASDVASLIKWFLALATHKAKLVAGDPHLVKRLGQLENRYRRLLHATA